MAKLNFNSVVAARTRAADQILSTPDLVAKYVALGGLARDLETIRKAGLEAEAANLGQSQSHSAGKSATVDILASFAALQKEYSSVMGVVSAVAAELSRNGGASDLVTKLNDILVNEAQLSVTVTTDEGGEKKRKARGSGRRQGCDQGSDSSRAQGRGPPTGRLGRVVPHARGARQPGLAGAIFALRGGGYEIDRRNPPNPLLSKGEFLLLPYCCPVSVSSLGGVGRSFPGCRERRGPRGVATGPGASRLLHG